MKYLFVFLLLCQTTYAQSLVASGSRQSIIVSGQAEALQTVSQSKPAETEALKPVETAKPPAVVQMPAARGRQWYLVSEPWCQHCPRAKAAFLAKGWPEQNVLTMAECKRRFGFSVPSVPYEFGEPVSTSPVQPYVQPARQASSLVNWQGRTYDANNYGGCSNPGCMMCKTIRSRRTTGYQTMSLPVVTPDKLLPDDQQPTPHDVVDQVVTQLQLTTNDVVADLGCGDGRILIAAVKRYGCSGVGIEIDPKRAELARTLIEREGLSSRIEIITGDVLQFCPEEYKVTAITAYLYPDLLEKLKDKMQSAKVIVSPFHQVPGMPMKQIGDVWVAHN